MSWCFRSFAFGHILHFKEIKNSSKDILIVSVTADEFVHKGPNRPVFRLYERMLNLSELSVVDFVVPSYSENAVSNTEFKAKLLCKRKRSQIKRKTEGI